MCTDCVYRVHTYYENHMHCEIMMERAPQIKQDEQFPLLKVDGGGGDGGLKPKLTSNLVAPGWGVTCTHKPAWIVRWPEYISACWMTVILLGISFLVFYTLGMEAYRRQPVLLIKCNGSKPASDVFYHQIIPKGNSPYIMLYSEYLSNMAYQYPLLHFHVYFLIDDSVQSGYRGPRRPRFINTLIPISLSNPNWFKLDDNSKRDLAEFQRKHHNINVTIMPLSTYMAMTPLKYKWRQIPLPYLTFYARVFSVWQYGGVGMDLSTFNNYFNNRQYVDRRISAILSQHNKGINHEEYTSALNKIDRDEESEFFSIFYGLVHSILNETCTFLTRSLPLPRLNPEKDAAHQKNEPLIRIHRNKRHIPAAAAENGTDKNPVLVEMLNDTNIADLKKNEYQTTFDSNHVNITHNDNITASKGAPRNDSFDIANLINLGRLNNSDARPVALNKSEHPQLVLFYDFSVISDGIAPPFVVSDALGHTDYTQMGKDKAIRYGNNNGLYLLSLDSEGVFIASSSKLHPFLGLLMAAGCQRMHPKLAIQDTILTQCSGIFKENPYCTSIYLL